MTVGRVVIVGAGQAGGWAARTLRDNGYSGTIVLVGDETHALYERPPLSKDILLGDATPDELTVVSADELASLKVQTRFGERIVRIDRDNRQVVLASRAGQESGAGQALPYDALILCTGGRARQLAIPGVDDVRVHTLRTLDDALRLRSAITSNSGHALVIGGGWIGLEVAASMRQSGCSVTVVECADRLCQRSVPGDVSDVLLDVHQQHGVQALLGTQIKALNPISGHNALEAVLCNGQTLHAQHVVMAAGLVANDELAVAAGLECANGIIVDDQCRTSDPFIYAAGDVAVVQPSMDGLRLRLESWQNAQDQGMAVAHAILGQPINYRPVPLLWSQQYDQFIQIAGYPDHAGRVVIRAAPRGGCVRFYLDNSGTVIGAVGMNAGRDWRFARQLVERQLRVDAADLADSEQPLKTLVTSAKDADFTHATATIATPSVTGTV